MMNSAARLFKYFLLCVLSGSVAISHAVGANTFKDRLDIPAELSPLAPNSDLIGVTRIAPNNHIAVGERGHILLSVDNGKSWIQSPAPLSSTLTSVAFPSPQQGWAVGHDGVILHTGDGGKQWERQLDGRKIGEAMVAWYQNQPPSDDPQRAKGMEEAVHFKEEGPSKPLLDVYFENDQSGWVIGSFNMILKTSDGGKTWEPWMDRVENPNGYSLHAMAAIDGEVYIVGELGLLVRLDRKQNRFVALKSPYVGSYFHLTGKPGVALIYGLRGNIFRSRDRGNTWQKLDSGIVGSLVGGTYLDDGRLVLVSVDGKILLSTNDGDTFTPVANSIKGSLTAVAPINADSVLITGSSGVHLHTLK